MCPLEEVRNKNCELFKYYERLRVSNENVVVNLKGNTLWVYWYLLQCPNNSSGPHQVQRVWVQKSCVGCLSH